MLLGGNHLLPLTSTRTTCFDTFLCGENSPKLLPPLLNTPPPMLVSKMRRIASLIESLGDNHPHSPTSTRLTCIDTYSRVKNHTRPPVSPSNIPLMCTMHFNMPLCVENTSRPMLPSPSLLSCTTCFNMSLHDETLAGPLQSLANTSPARTTCFDTSLCVENPSGVPKPPSDATQTYECGVLPHHSPCIT